MEVTFDKGDDYSKNVKDLGKVKIGTTGLISFPKKVWKMRDIKIISYDLKKHPIKIVYEPDKKTLQTIYNGETTHYK